MDDFYATYGHEVDLAKYAKLAARLCGRTCGLVHLIDEKNQYTLGTHNFDVEIGHRMDRCDSICDYTANLQKGQVLSISDASIDIRVRHMPAVTGPPQFRWYLGTPIWSRDNRLIGALCVLDVDSNLPKSTPDMEDSLVSLAESIANVLDLRADCNVASKAKKEFLTSVSHELRDPMHGISMSLALLSSSSALHSGDLEVLDAAKKCTVTLKTLVDQLLIVNEPIKESWMRNEDEDIFDIVQSTELCLDSSWLASYENNSKAVNAVECSFEASQELHDASFRMNGKAYLRIVLNLFSNALKYTESGFVRVKLSLEDCNNAKCERQHATHKTIRLAIHDSGCGLSPEFVARAFEPFTRADTVKTGVGIGLSVVKKLVEHCHGTLSLETKHNEGSRFDVTLCVDPVPAGDSADLKEALPSRAYYMSSDISETYSTILEQYSSALGMQRVSKEAEADFLLSMSDLGGRSARQIPMINIYHDPVEALKNSSCQRTVAIAMPIGPLKLRKAFKEVISYARALKEVASDNSDHTVIAATPVLNASRNETTALASQPQPSLPSKRTCLVVDDNAVNVRILSTFLKRHGFECNTACDGIEAIDAVKACDVSRQFEMIFMDINMPRLNGVKAARLIEEYQFSSRISKSQIVAVSGCSDAERRTVMSLGMKKFFKKPVDLKELAQFLHDPLVV